MDSLVGDSKTASRAGFFESVLIVAYLVMLSGAFERSSLPEMHSLFRFLLGGGIAYLGFIGSLVGSDRFRYHSSVLVAWIILAAASVSWSALPWASAQAAIELARTFFVALYLSRRLRPDEFFNLLFWSLAFCAVGSLASVVFSDYGLMTGTSRQEIVHEGSLRGLFLHKNTFGLWMGLAVSLSSWKILRGGAQAMSGLFIFALSAVLTYKSQSTTGVIIALVLILCTLVFMFRPKFQTLALTSLVGLGLLFATGTHALGQILALFGKNETFTGRTEIWSSLVPYLREHLWLGHGYDSFWEKDIPPLNPKSPSYALEFFLNWKVTSAHNAFLDVWLHLGMLGTILLIIVLGVYYFRACRILFSKRYTMNADYLCRFKFFILGIFFVLGNLTESHLMHPKGLMTLLFMTLYLFLERDAREQTRSLA